MLSLTPIRAASRNANIADAADAIFRPMSRESGDQDTAQDRPADPRGEDEIWRLPAAQVCGSSSTGELRCSVTGWSIARWCIGRIVDPTMDCCSSSRYAGSGDLPALVILMILVPAFPSRVNTTSMPTERKGACARRRRPASARGFLASCAGKGDHRSDIRRQKRVVQRRSLSKLCAGP